MAGSGFHVVPLGKKGKNRLWGVEDRGGVCFSHRKRDAIRAGRALAKEARASLRIHGENGRILEERSFGNETRRPG